MRRFTPALFAALALATAGPAAAAGGDYGFAGGTAREQAQVVAALNASAFDWGLVPVRITIHIAQGGPTEAAPGDIWIDGALLDAGVFSWGTVQHEYAHQVDFFLLDDAKRQYLEQLLGGRDWCYSLPALPHSAYGCERFASTLAWAYWPSKANTMRPSSPGDESAAMDAARFRSVLAALVGAPSTSLPAHVTAYAPKTARPRRR